MQRSCSYPKWLRRRFSGKAECLLLPKMTPPTIIGQSRSVAFTQNAIADDFRAMQRVCFYPKCLHHRFSGKAEVLLLPKMTPPTIFGQSRGVAFPKNGSADDFRAKQRCCFYPKWLRRRFSGKAEGLLLPKMNPPPIFGQSRGVAFTQNAFAKDFRAKQRVCFSPK
jgi:hypothetical protein